MTCDAVTNKACITSQRLFLDGWLTSLTLMRRMAINEPVAKDWEVQQGLQGSMTITGVLVEVLHSHGLDTSRDLPFGRKGSGLKRLRDRGRERRLQWNLRGPVAAVDQQYHPSPFVVSIARPSRLPLSNTLLGQTELDWQEELPERLLDLMGCDIVV